MPHAMFPSPSQYRISAEDAAAPVPPIEAVLFDFSNTLFRMISVEEWLRRTLVVAGRETAGVDAEAVAERMEAVFAEPEVQAAQIDRDVTEARHRAAMRAWWSRVPDLDGLVDLGWDVFAGPDGWDPYPDTLPVLRELRRRGVPVAVVSDIGWDLRPILAAHGVAEYVAGYGLSCEVGVEKPNAAMFHKACADLGVDPRRALMVGDHPPKDGGATGAGLRAFLLPAELRTGERGLADVLRLV